VLEDAEYVAGVRDAAVAAASVVRRAPGGVEAGGERLAEVLATSALLVPVGRVREAVAVLSAYAVAAVDAAWAADVRGLLAAEAAAPAGGAAEEEVHLVALTALFEAVAGVAHDAAAAGVTAALGGGAMVGLCVALQASCDGGVSAILRRWSESRRVADVERTVAAETADARDLDSLLDELGVLAARAAAYGSFVTDRCVEAVDAHAAEVAEGGGEGGDARDGGDGGSGGGVVGGGDTGGGASGAGAGGGGGGGAKSYAPPTSAASSTLVAAAADAAPSLPASATTADSDGCVVDLDGRLRAGTPPPGGAFPATLQASALTQWVSDLTSKYITFEAYCMRSNAAVALQMDSADPLPADAGPGTASAQVSTAVDDVFFVLQKCVRRAAAYGDTTDALAAIMTHAHLILAADVAPFLHARLSTAPMPGTVVPTPPASPSPVPLATSTSATPLSYLGELARLGDDVSGSLFTSASATATGSGARGGGGGGGGSGGGGGGGAAATPAAPPYDLLTALNNLRVAASYTHRLRADAEAAAAALATSRGTSGDRALSAGGGLGDAARCLADDADAGVASLVTALVTPVSRRLDDLLASTSYRLPDAALDEDRDGAAGAAVPLVAVLSRVLGPTVEVGLVDDNWDALVRGVAEWAASKLEALVFGGRGGGSGGGGGGGGGGGSGGGGGGGGWLNAVGAVVLERDVRKVAAFFGARSRRGGVRDVFARLAQAAGLANAETVAEAAAVVREAGGGGGGGAGGGGGGGGCGA